MKVKELRALLTDYCRSVEEDEAEVRFYNADEQRCALVEVSYDPIGVVGWRKVGGTLYCVLE